LKQYAVIFNPCAGKGRAAKMEAQLRRILREKLGEVDIFPTLHPAYARQISLELKDKYQTIIVAGGDGTIHEVVNGMVGGSAALGFVPIGSGNDFVRMMHIPHDLSEAVDVIRTGRQITIDVGQLGDEFFPNGIGVGFDAWVVKESLKIKRLRGIFMYLYAVLKTVFRYKNQTVTISVNGKSLEEDIFLVAIGNGKSMGGGFLLNPTAEINDGQLDICIIRGLKFREIFMHLPKALSGSHVHLEQVEVVRSDKIDINAPNGIAVHADGELLGMDFKELNVTVRPRCLTVIANTDV
jgi:diacylglycerol kinase (ATP)